MNILNWLKPIAKKVEGFTVQNAPHLLMGLGTGMSISALISAIRATPNAVEAKKHAEHVKIAEKTGMLSVIDKTPYKLTVWETIQACAKYYGPAAAMELLALICFWTAHGIDIRRQAVLSGLYATAEQALQEYQRKVQKMLGEKQEKDIRNEIAQDTVDRVPVPANQTYFIDGSTERWFIFKNQRFRSTYPRIKDAQNEANHEMIKNLYISEAEVMWLLDPSKQYLRPDSDSGKVGWSVDELMEFDISWGEDPNHEPVGIVTIYNKDGVRYDPQPGFSSSY